MANTEGHHGFLGAKLEEICQKALTIWTTISLFQDGNLTDIFLRVSIKESRNFSFKSAGEVLSERQICFLF